MTIAAVRLAPLHFPKAQAFAVSVVAAVADDAGGARLGALLAALRDARLAVPYEVIVAVRGPVPVALRCAHPLVAVLQAPPEADLGALYDLGAQAAVGKHLLLLDGSAVPDAAAVAELVRFADSGQWIGCVVPRYAERPASRAFPAGVSALREALGLATPIACDPAPRLPGALDRRATTPKEVDAAEPGCVLVRKQALVDAGGFAAGYAPGGELLDWCMRARRKGWAVFYHPGVAAADLPGAPTPDRRAIARRFARRFLF